MVLADWIGFVGVGLLLLAFLLNLLHKISQRSFIYVALNLVGAALACLASILINYIPFIILEGAWTLVSIGSMIYLLARNKPSKPLL